MGEEREKSLKKSEAAILGRIPTHTPNIIQAIKLKIGRIAITQRAANNLQGPNNEHSQKSAS